MVNQDLEEGHEQQPVNQPGIPGQFINGYQNWYIVIDEQGQQVIELVDSDDEFGPPMVGPPPGEHVEAPVLVGENENPPAAHAHGLLPQANGVFEAVEVIDMGVQVDGLELAHYSGTYQVQGDPDNLHDMEEAMDFEEGMNSLEVKADIGYDPGRFGYCRGCGGALLSSFGRFGNTNKGRRPQRFYGMQHYQE